MPQSTPSGCRVSVLGVLVLALLAVLTVTWLLWNSHRRREAEDRLWIAAQQSRDPAAIQEYLRLYPTGRHVRIAELMLAGLRGRDPGGARAQPFTNSADGMIYLAVEGGLRVMRTEVPYSALAAFARAVPGAALPPAPDYNPRWADESLPAVNVTWQEAEAFCRWGGGRLPTAAEWETIAKPGANPDLESWHLANSGGIPHPVGARLPNAVGLQDTLGNVEEWCGTAAAPAVCGGSARDLLRSLKPRLRRAAPAQRSPLTGFRCVLP